MDAATVTVASPETSRNLVRLDYLRERLGITGEGNDPELSRLIAARSQAIYAWCGIAGDQLGRRTMALESIVATWMSGYRRSSLLVLPWRIPVVTITSIVEDGITLDADDYRVHPMSAMLERLDEDVPRAWDSGKIVVTYTAGWVDIDDDATTIPADLQEACLAECVSAWVGRKRDASLRSETMPDVHAYTVAFGQDGTRDRLLPETMSALGAGGYRAATV